MIANMRFIVLWGSLGPTKVVVCFHHQSPAGLHLLPDYDVIGLCRSAGCGEP